MPKNLTVLLVEDSKSDAALIVRELNKQGYELEYERVENPDEVAKALAKPKWDLIISDYVLPDFSGLRLLQMLDDNNLDIPCIITSGRIDEETAVAAMRAGAKDYVMKDNLKRLGPVIERELSEAQERRERRKTQEKLRENEAKLRLVLEQLPSIVWTTDNELSITSVLGAGLELLGLNARQLTDISIADFSRLLAQGDNLVLAHRKVLAGMPMSFEWVAPHQGLVYYTYAEPLRSSEGAVIGVVGISLDITERKKAEEYRTRLAAIVETSNDAIVSASLDGVINSWNKAAEKIYGYSAEEVLGNPVSLLTDPDFGSDIPYIIDKVKRGEKVVNYETVRRRKDGAQITVSLTLSPLFSDAGELTGIATLARDITEHKILERRILLGNQILQLFWEVTSKKDYLEKAVDLIRAWCSCDCVGIRVVDAEENTIPYLAHRGFSQSFLERENYLSLQTDVCACTRTVMGRPEPQDTPAMTTGGSFFLTHSTEFAGKLTPGQLARFRGVCIESGYQTVLIVPVRHVQTVLGAIHLADKKYAAITPSEVETIESVSKIIGQGIYRFDIEDKIRTSEARLAEAQKIAHLGNWEWHVQSGELFWSDEIYHIFGLDSLIVQVTYQGFLNYIHPEDRVSVEQAVYAALYEKMPYGIDHRIVLSSGEVRIVHEQGIVVYDDYDKPLKMIGTIQDITGLKRIEEELRALSRRLVEVQESERRTIARELHDEIGQSLTALKMLLSQAARQQGKEVSPSLNEAKTVTSDLMNQVREMSLNLRPSMLDDLGLLPTLQWHFERFAAQTGIKIDFNQDGLEQKLPPEINTTVYRVVQEALTNVARYAEVDKAAVTIRIENNELRLQIDDMGRGFLPEELRTGSSTGLSGMRERVRLLGGKLALESSPGSGTHILVELPVKSESST